MARPKRDQAVSRSERVTLRLAPSEIQVLEARARAAGMTVSEFARQAACTGVSVRTVDIAHVDPALIVAINRVGVNLNQIARHLNGGGKPVPNALSYTLARVNEYLDKVQT